MRTLTNLPLVSKLSSKVIRILGCNPGVMTLQGTNTYLVGTGARRVLIDAGEAESSTAYLKLLDEVLKEENATIEHLVVTHWHEDHIGGVNYVQKLLRNKYPQSKPATVWKFRRTDEDESTDSINWQPLVHDQTVEVEGAKLQIKYTPGHTTDHACLLLQDDKTLFSGDCILGEGTTVFEDLHDYMRSLKEIILLEPKTIYPGHGPVLENPIPRIEYYIKHRQERENQILSMIQEYSPDVALSEFDIVKNIYKETPEDLWPAATINVKHHLEKLRKEGKVKGESGEWYNTSTTLKGNL